MTTNKSGSAVLGNTAKSASAKAEQTRLERFALQSEARHLSPPKDRIQGCLRWPTGGGNGRVAVYYREASKYAYYGGLQTCGSIWKCPVCAAKITERRRVLWQSALSAKNAELFDSGQGELEKRISPHFRLSMATFTIQHKSTDRLIDVIEKLERAYSLMWSGRWAVEFKRLGGVIGTIRALEVTYGISGWHPHIHCLLISTTDDMRYNLNWYRGNLKQRWMLKVEKSGGYASFASGVDYQISDMSIIEYIDKLGVKVNYEKQSYGLVAEETKYPTKKSSNDHDGIFGLLSRSLHGETDYGSRWQLAQAILKGRKHIATSKGLLRLLGASQELSDDHLAATDLRQTGDELLALLSREEWGVIDKHELRGYLLNVANTGSRQAVEDFLIEVGARK